MGTFLAWSPRVSQGITKALPKVVLALLAVEVRLDVALPDRVPGRPVVSVLWKGVWAL